MSYFTGKIPTPTDGFTARLDYEVYTDDECSYVSDLVGKVKRNNSSYHPYNSSKTCTIKIYRLDDDDDWILVKTLSDSSSYNINTDSYVTFIDKSSTEVTIRHKSDGSQKVKLVFAVDGELSSYYPNGSITKTITLDDIDPDPSPTYTASRLNSASMTIGADETVSMSINLTKSNSNYYDTLLVYNQSGTLLLSSNLSTMSGQLSLTFTNPTAKQAIFNSIGSSFTTTLNCKLATYTDSQYSNLKGYSSTLSFSASIPSYTLAIDSVSVVDSETDYDTYKPTASTYIANISKPTLTLSASSSTGYTYGKAISYLINGINRTSPYTDTTFNGNNYTIIATDNRVNSVSTTTSLTIVNYVKPTISCTMERNTVVPSKANVSISGSYYGGSGLTNLETATITIKYSEAGGTPVSSQVSFTPTLQDGVYNISETFELSGLDAKKVLDWEITLSDLVGYETSATGNLTKQYPLWHGYTDANDIQHLKIYGDLDVTDSITINNTALSSFISSAVSTALLSIYPVGALYISTTNTNPSNFIGGTWTQITSDAYLKIVTSSAGSLGGTSSDHKIPITSMPSHNHAELFTKRYWGGTSSRNVVCDSTDQTDLENVTTTGSRGGGQAYYPYYYGVYVWKRTA